MGLLNDFKKLFFGAKAVSKHQTERAADAAKSEADRLAQLAKDKTNATLHRAEDLFEDAAERGEDLFVKAADKGEELVKGAADKAKELLGKAGKTVDQLDDHPAVREAIDQVETTGRGVLEAGKSTLETAADLSEQVGEQVIKHGKEGLERAADLAENVGRKINPVLGDMANTFGDAADQTRQRAKSFYDEAQQAAAEAGRDADSAKSAGDHAKAFFDRAQDAAAKAGRPTGDYIPRDGDALTDQAQRTAAAADDLFDDLTQRAQNMGDEAAARANRPRPDVSRSELAGKDDFFTKAARFAEGDYDMDGKRPGDRPVDGKITVIDNTNDHVKRQLPAPDRPPVGGFEDRDGDGNEIIDDAEIVD